MVISIVVNTLLPLFKDDCEYVDIGVGGCRENLNNAYR